MNFSSSKEFSLFTLVNEDWLNKYINSLQRILTFKHSNPFSCPNDILSFSAASVKPFIIGTKNSLKGLYKRICYMEFG